MMQACRHERKQGNLPFAAFAGLWHFTAQLASAKCCSSVVCSTGKPLIHDAFRVFGGSEPIGVHHETAVIAALAQSLEGLGPKQAHSPER